MASMIVKRLMFGICALVAGAPALTSAMPLSARSPVPASMMAELTEEGYQQVAALTNDIDMAGFIRRVMESMGLRPKDEGELQGFSAYYSGTKDTQSLDRMKEELQDAAWAEKVEGSKLGQDVNKLANKTRALEQAVAGKQAGKQAAGKKAGSEGAPVRRGAKSASRTVKRLVKRSTPKADPELPKAKAFVKLAAGALPKRAAKRATRLLAEPVNGSVGLNMAGEGGGAKLKDDHFVKLELQVPKSPPLQAMRIVGGKAASKPTNVRFVRQMLKVPDVSQATALRAVGAPKKGVQARGTTAVGARRIPTPAQNALAKGLHASEAAGVVGLNGAGAKHAGKTAAKVRAKSAAGKGPKHQHSATA